MSTKISSVKSKLFDPKTFSDKIYDAVTIYEGIEEVENVGIRKGLEQAISIIETDKLEREK